MRSLVEVSFRRPIGVMMAALAVVAMGAIALFTLPVDFYPDLTVPTILVSTSYPGSDAETVRQSVTIPLEDGLGSLPGVKQIRSVTRPGNAVIELEFAWGTDMVLAGVRVREAVDARYPLLPDGADKPRIIPADPNVRPLLTLAAIPRSGDLAFARDLADRELKTALQQVVGVGSVILVGGEEKEVRVEVNQNLVSARGLGVSTLASAIRSEIVRVPAGTVREGSVDYVVATDAEPKSLADLGEIPVAAGGLLLRDIADIRMDTRPRDSVFFVGGAEAVGLVIRGGEGANPVATAELVRAAVTELSARYGRDIDLVVVEDGTTPIRSVIRSLGLGLGVGAAMAFLVLLVTVRNWRSAVVILASIPFSVAAAVAGMWAFGIGINTMSLGGLALGLGMIVDASVVTVERLLRRGDGESGAGAVSSVAGAVFGSTLTSVIVFSPILLLPGLLGAVYRDLAAAVVFALLASFVVSITVTPVLGSWLRIDRRTAAVHRPRRYAGMLRFVLRRPWVAILGGVVVAGAGVWAMTELPVEFSPDVSTGQFYAQLDFDENARIEWVADHGVALSGYLSSVTGVEAVFGRVGGEDEDIFYRGDATQYPGRLSLSLQYDRDVDGVAAQLRADIRAFAERVDAQVRFEVDADPLESLLRIGGDGVSYTVTGTTPDRAADAAAALSARFTAAGYPAELAQANEATTYRFEPLRDKNQGIGATSRELALALRASVEGMPAGMYREAGRDYPITVALPDDLRRDPSRIADLILVADGTRTVRAGELYDIEQVPAPVRLVRVDRKDAVTVRVLAPSSASLDELAAVATSSRSVLAYEARTIGFLLLASLTVLYLLMGAIFESWTKPMLILSSVPVALAGTAAALAASGYTLNVQSGLGLVVLMGLVVNNAILLTDALGGRRDGVAVYRAALNRFRPIVITTLTTILALLPTALGVFGPSPQASMAAAVAGGLALSTVVSLFLIPVLSRGRTRNV